MRVACVGGGPGGLYLAVLLALADPAHEVTVYERNAPDDTFGFGVVFSDETLGAFAAADPVSYAAITDAFVQWGDIDTYVTAADPGRGVAKSGRLTAGSASLHPLAAAPATSGRLTAGSASLHPLAAAPATSGRLTAGSASLHPLAAAPATSGRLTAGSASLHPLAAEAAEKYTSGGHGFSAMSRRRLLGILQERAASLGVKVCFRTEAPDVRALADSHDVVVGADGVHSAVRDAFAGTFGPTVEPRRCRYIWLGSDLPLDAFTFWILRTPWGPMQAHAYPFAAGESTVIVEMHETVWRAAGFDREPAATSVARCEELFAELLGGHRLTSNNSRWIEFPTVRNAAWRHGNVVLLGDAAHTAHFSIGSGTKLAMEDSIALAAALGEHSDVGSALAAYEAERRPVVESTQRAAQASLEWFEGLDRYLDQHPLQFVFGLLTRSRRITYENLRVRDPAFVARVDAWFAEEVAAQLAATPPELVLLSRGIARESRTSPEGRSAATAAPPMFTPFRVRDLVLPNRVVVSPMDMYSAVDGLIGDFHLVHLGARALGGAGLVMTEMVCVSPEGRITPGCAGLYTAEQAAAWRRVVEFVHGNSPARIGLQIGHSGRKGSTKLMWEGVDLPLDDGNWPLLAPSPVPYLPVSQVPREMDAADLVRVKAEFVAAARAGAEIGFDLLELHMAHGYLLSSFLTPLANRRTDAYGGPLANRARYPLEVLDAVRAVWPGPLSVRISATDWVPGGFDADDAVAFARMLVAHGVDIVDVSTGQTSPDARPAFGRSYQTPYSDRIRNEVGVPTIAVGAISSDDDVNSIILAGRADLCALARPHLYDPAWTLHAAAEQGYPGVEWPVQYRAGSRRPPTGRT